MLIRLVPTLAAGFDGMTGSPHLRDESARNSLRQLEKNRLSAMESLGLSRLGTNRISMV